MLSCEENTHYWANATRTPVVVPTTGTPLPPESQTAGQPVKIGPFKDALQPQHHELRYAFDNALSPAADGLDTEEYNKLLDDLVNIVRKSEDHPMGQ